MPIRITARIPAFPQRAAAHRNRLPTGPAPVLTGHCAANPLRDRLTAPGWPQEGLNNHVILANAGMTDRGDLFRAPLKQAVLRFRAGPDVDAIAVIMVPAPPGLDR